MKQELQKDFLFFTVDEAISDFLKQRNKILQLSNKDVIRSAAFYAAFNRLSEEFIEEVKKHEFPTMPGELWGYDVVYDYTVIGLQLEKYVNLSEESEDKVYETIESYNILKVEAKLLSVEEYAKMYEINPKTVTQWIRRGKIRTAKKIGNAWMIPEVTDTPPRGYTPATYYLEQDIRPLSDEYKFLIGVEHLTIMQDDVDKTKYRVYCFNESSISSIHKQNYNQREKEKFELALIAHPAVKYQANFSETVWADFFKSKGV